jgi:hypothetical protein
MELIVQAELTTSLEREKELTAQIADLRQQQSGSEQERQQELASLRAELAEFTSGMTQRDSELQVLLILLHMPTMAALRFCSWHQMALRRFSAQVPLCKTFRLP